MMGMMASYQIWWHYDVVSRNMKDVVHNFVQCN